MTFTQVKRIARYGLISEIKFMCLIAFALNKHPQYPFILIANRDEFYDRPTAPAHFWPEYPDILAGKDLKAGGTWLGITKSGRLAALTNYRDIQNIDPAAQSRGELTTGFLRSKETAKEYLENLHINKNSYNGYNLLVYAGLQMYHYSNYEQRINHLADGIYGLSNALLDTSWYKVEKTKKKFSKAVKGKIDEDIFFEILSDRSTAADNQLPETGLTHDLEKAVSAVCIRTENYGTCSSTIVTISKENNVTFVEKTYAVGDRKDDMRRFAFTIE